MAGVLRALKYLPKEILSETKSAIAFIIIGLVLITTVQLLFPYTFAPIGRWVHFPNLGISTDDWNTVRAIWFAEVPLAYLLRRILGGAKLEYIESQQRDYENLNLALEKRNMTGLHEYVKQFRMRTGKVVDGEPELANEDKKLKYWNLTSYWPMQFIANTRTRKIFKTHGAISLLGPYHMIDLDQSYVGYSYEKLLEYVKTTLHEDGKAEMEFVKEREADISDLLPS